MTRLFHVFRWVLAFAIGIAWGISSMGVPEGIALLVFSVLGWEIVCYAWERACTLPVPDASREQVP